MYKTEDNKKIGKYIGGLIKRMYESDRQFAIKYIKLRDNSETEPEPEEIQRVANKICQIKKGTKGMQITDLPIFADLLEISIDNLLSAGKIFKPVTGRMTNYSVAFTKDEKTWKEYIERPDKLILNEDEYGKTVIDYAIEFKNYSFLKYLVDNKYIFFISKFMGMSGYTFGAGTSIKRREPWSYDLLDVKMRERDDLRTNMIVLAIENKDYCVLDEMKAREIPSLYLEDCVYAPNLQLEKYYNQQMMDTVAKSDDEVLIYFSEEFEIDMKRNVRRKYTFPYLGKLIDMVVKGGGNVAARMLKNSLKHNNYVLGKIINIADGIKETLCDMGRMNEKERIQKEIMNYFYFDEKDNIVTYFSGWPIKNTQKLFSNVIHVSESSKEEYINCLIEDVNASYEKIRNFNGEI